MSGQRKIALMGLITALASGLFAVECMIPSPLPWMRLGLANSLSLLAIVWWGWREGLLVLVLRVFLGALITGRLMQPVFYMSLLGGLAAVIIMGVMHRWGRRWFSLIGISVAGAVVKNFVQLLVAALFLVGSWQVFRLSWLFLLGALLGGVTIGVLVAMLDRRQFFRQ